MHLNLGMGGLMKKVQKNRWKTAGKALNLFRSAVTATIASSRIARMFEDHAYLHARIRSEPVVLVEPSPATQRPCFQTIEDGRNCVFGWRSIWNNLQ